MSLCLAVCGRFSFNRRPAGCRPALPPTGEVVLVGRGELLVPVVRHGPCCARGVGATRGAPAEEGEFRFAPPFTTHEQASKHPRPLPPPYSQPSAYCAHLSLAGAPPRAPVPPRPALPPTRARATNLQRVLVADNTRPDTSYPDSSKNSWDHAHTEAPDHMQNESTMHTVRAFAFIHVMCESSLWRPTRAPDRSRARAAPGLVPRPSREEFNATPPSRGW